MEKTCCFSGHRPSKLPWRYNESDPRCESLKKGIYEALETAYRDGYRHFVCGMAQGCDLYFCEEAIALRHRYGDVTIEAAIPCPGQPDRWPEAERIRYSRLRDACDYKTLIQREYTPGCMAMRNRYMVSSSTRLIAVHNGLPGGTSATIAEARQRGLEVVELKLQLQPGG